MTERRPPGVDYESWIDRQISEAEKRGKFDDLPTAGKPLPDLGRTDENWWIKGKLREEGLSKGPPVVFRPFETERVLRNRRRRRSR